MSGSKWKDKFELPDECYSIVVYNLGVIFWAQKFRHIKLIKFIEIF